MKERAERTRLQATRNNHGWKKWGPYLSERQWGTVREDYSDHGYAWGSVTHEMARSWAYRWGEDGIAGLSDNKQNFCFSFAFWNEQDAIIKERLFGLSNGEGNHGEDVKELYYYLDSTPTHSYMKMLYKYPQQAFPYSKLVDTNRTLDKKADEYELIDTGIFDEDRYFDIFVEYVKAAEEDILVRVTAHNRGPEAAPLHIIPHLFFRNTWSWGYDSYRPVMFSQQGFPLVVEHRDIGNYRFYYQGDPDMLFTENDTNKKIYNRDPQPGEYYKDGINNYIVNGSKADVKPVKNGTKAALHYKTMIDSGKSVKLQFRFAQGNTEAPFKDFDEVVKERKQEADYFYEGLQKGIKDADLRDIQRQAFAGMLWSKQFYYYNVNQWLEGDPAMLPVPQNRKYGRNKRWRHLYNENIISMPDKWEYPWYAAWDLAFHVVTLAKVDTGFAKRQMLLLLREYYMHPNGQIPAYEWSFSDVNPPVHAWGSWKVYSLDKEMNGGVGDTEFLSKIFMKLVMNFTWWINQKDKDENNLFDGGFLGLDNIGVFDRSSSAVPGGNQLEQADATSWMAMYSLNMLRMAIELSKVKPHYQEMASKFFEHFLNIAGAMSNFGDDASDLWDDEDRFYYDMMHNSDGSQTLLKVRSLVGLLPLFAVEVFSSELLTNNPEFTRRLEFALKNRPDLASKISRWLEIGRNGTRMLSLVRKYRMKCILNRMIDEAEFLSPYGIRGLSKYHEEHPYKVHIDGHEYSVSYIPGESDSSMFGGNSNWRGPIWFPVNYLLIESLRKFHSFYGDEFTLEYPKGSGTPRTLKYIADDIANRLISIFTKRPEGRVVYQGYEKLQQDPHFSNYILFHEYFNGDNGKGLGASHQTGWTGLVASLIDELYADRVLHKQDHQLEML